MGQTEYRFLALVSFSFCFHLIDSDVCNDKQCFFVNKANQLSKKRSLDLRTYSQLYGTVKKLMSIQRVPNFLRSTSIERLNNLAAMQNWCQTRMSDGLNITEHSLYEYGVFASREIKVGESLFEFPINETFSETYIRGQLPQLEHVLKPPADLEEAELIQWTHHAWLPLHVISERLRGDSFWASYLNMLPSKLVAPLYYSPHELAFLIGSDVYAEIINFYQTVIELYSRIFLYLSLNPDACEEIGLTREKFTFSLYGWAVSMHHTRSYSDGRTNILIPCWDFVNHGTHIMRTQTYYENTARGAAFVPSMVAADAQILLRSGEELTHNYMPTSNDMADFMVNWGIIYPQGSLRISLTLVPSDPLYRSKLLRLKKNGRTTEDEITMSQSMKRPVLPGDYKILLLFALGKSYRSVNARDWTRAWRYLSRELRHKSSRYRYNANSAKLKLSDNALTELGQLALKEIIAELNALENMRTLCKRLSKNQQNIKY